MCIRDRVKGYEHYGVIADNAENSTPEQAVQDFVGLQVAGTPDECLEQIQIMQEKVGFDHLISVFSYGGMPPVETERNMRLFATEVMPKLHEQRAVVTVGNTAHTSAAK